MIQTVAACKYHTYVANKMPILIEGVNMAITESYDAYFHDITVINRRGPHVLAPIAKDAR